MIHFSSNPMCDKEADRLLPNGWDAFASRALVFAVDMHSAVEYLVRKTAEHEAKEFFVQ